MLPKCTFKGLYRTYREPHPLEANRPTNLQEAGYAPDCKDEQVELFVLGQGLSSTETMRWLKWQSLSSRRESHTLSDCSGGSCLPADYFARRHRDIYITLGKTIKDRHFHKCCKNNKQCPVDSVFILKRMKFHTWDFAVV